MKIAAYDIAMTSQHRLVEMDERQESLRYWTGDRSGQTEQSSLNQLAVQMKQDILEISDAARILLAEQVAPLSPTQDDPALYELSDGDKMKIQMIQDFIQTLTGKKMKFVIPQAVKIKLDSATGKAVLQINTVQQALGRPRVGWGLAYDFHHSHYEREQMTFASSGVVKTADGREIRFDLALAMSREYASQTNVSIRAGDALVDPLVINFAAPAASLSPAKIAFDLDADGDKEQISFVGQGSGFLTLDKNGDGKVSDGSELFGPASGNGFADLAAYDTDGNQWIDENDPIYSQLRIWTRDADGGDRLLALGQTGVGAIYLGSVDTAFGYKDGANQLHGQLRSTGLFLRENGTAGTIQQVDLAV